MTTTTFGYDPLQDRVWMRVHHKDSTVWLTRRMVVHIMGPVLKRFEASTPGAEGGAPPSVRAAIEHDLTLHETQPGQTQPLIKAGRETPGESSDPQQGLCKRITTNASGQTISLLFGTDAGPLELRLSRRGMHLWFRGLTMVLKQAQWDLPEALPEWLMQGVMPPALQKIVDQPLSDPDQPPRSP